MATATAEKPKQNTQLAKQKAKFNDLRQLLERGKGQLQLAMAKHLDPDRMIRLALTAATRNPKLLDCTQESICLSLLTASQLGIEPNGRDGHLVPYGKECQFLPDFKGLIKLAYRNPRVNSFTATAVRSNDEFEFVYGTESFLRHRPALSDRGELLCAYAICKLKDAEAQFVVMGKDDIEKRREKAMTHKIWDAWPDEMWAKTAIKSLAKFVPLGGEFEKAVTHDSEVEGGNPITVEFTNIAGPEDDDRPKSEQLADKLEKNATKAVDTALNSEAYKTDDAQPPSAFDLFKTDMHAATNLAKLTQIKNDALAESQQGIISVDEWQELQSLCSKLSKSF